MAQARNSLRAYLVDRTSPAEALCRLHQLFLRTLPGDIATAAVADTVSRELRIAHAGHPPAVLLRGALATLLPESGDALIGAGRGDYGEYSLRLEPGDALVLYSDDP
jgi:serine phosphatase RsbU (regulator of sigma subunit)